MSHASSAYIGTNERVAYTVEHRHNCVLITGPVPASAFTVLARLAPQNAVMDPDLARMAGANFAIGLPKDLAAWRAELAPDAMRRERIRNTTLSDAAVKWLAQGERGASSNSMFDNLLRKKARADKDHPHDTSDFRRCRLLVEQVPEIKALLPEMARVSPEWASLVAAWDHICAAMDNEFPDWRDGGRHEGKTHKTYNLIRSALAAKYHAH